MSRIGKKPVALPKGVTAQIDGQTVKVKGPKGELSVKLVPEVGVSMGEHGIQVVYLDTVIDSSSRILKNYTEQQIQR